MSYAYYGDLRVTNPNHKYVSSHSVCRAPGRTRYLIMIPKGPINLWMCVHNIIETSALLKRHTYRFAIQATWRQIQAVQDVVVRIGLEVTTVYRRRTERSTRNADSTTKESFVDDRTTPLTCFVRLTNSLEMLVSVLIKMAVPLPECSFQMQ